MPITMAQQALDASGCAFQETDMELSLPVVILHQEEGNVSETLHNSDEEGNVLESHSDEDTLDNPPPRESIVVKVTQAPGSLPRVNHRAEVYFPILKGGPHC